MALTFSEGSIGGDIETVSLRELEAFYGKRTMGRVTPENWTHGSAEARMKWFTQGYTTGDINQCNTFGVDTVT